MGNIYYDDNSIKIYNCDVFEMINDLEDNTLDLIVTSPPYNVDLGNNKYNKNRYDIYKDNLEHKEYLHWIESIFRSFFTKVKEGGRVCINIGDGKNGVIPTHSDFIQLMNDIGYSMFTTIVWDKSQIGNRTAWGSFNSPSNPSFPTPFEYVLVFFKNFKKLQWKGETDLDKKEFIDWSLALWRFAPETRMKKIGHPAMFPEELPKRLIKMLSWKDSLVCDPFSGAGTTAKVCKDIGRRFIGSELSREYCDIAIERLGE